VPNDGFVVYPTTASVQRRTWAAPRRALLLVIVAVVIVVGFLATSSEATAQAIAQAGPALARLLRAMAGIKALATIALVAVTYWRLAAPIGRGRFVAYALACGAMAAGPGLIWGMAHLEVGALLLHGGLAMSVLLIWRDPEMATCIETEIARRRARLQV